MGAFLLSRRWCNTGLTRKRPIANKTEGKYATGVCAYDKCKKPFPKKAPNQKYCHDPAECKRLAYNESRRKDLGTGECLFCGEEFSKKTDSQKYCPRPASCKSDYEKAGRRVDTVNQCRQCGNDFTVDVEHKVYCPECKENVDPAAETLAKIDRDRRKRELTEALLDEAARTDVLKKLTAAQERVEGWQPKRFNVDLGHKYPPEHANMIFSDWHLGEKITKEESGGLAEYNMAIGRKRLERCVTSQAKIVKIHNDGGVPIDHCNVWLLGDIVTGEKIYKGQHAYIDAYTADQVVTAKNLLGEVLLNMLDIYKTINCYCIVGNHGRMGEKGEGPTWNNFDYLLYNWTADLLMNHPEVKWHIPRSWFTLADPLGWRFCLSHGDDVQMYKRIPWYGLERDVNDMAAMLWDIEQAPPNYWLYAHFHTAEQAELTHGERIMNGSVVGGSMLSAKGLKRVSRPSQTFFGLSRSTGITWRYSLWLDKPKKKAV